MIEKAKQVLQNEADAILRLKELIDEQFVQSLELIFHAKGRIVVTGIGKSAIIAQKMVATFNSTGTPAIFMHAAEAIHGDLGIIQPDDVVICLSKSGNTPDISVLMPFLMRSGNKIIAIVGNPNSFWLVRPIISSIVRWKKRRVPIIWRPPAVLPLKWLSEMRWQPV